jgi:exonuclease III
VKLVTGHGSVKHRALHGKYATGTTRKARPPIPIKLCTWNVRGLNKLGKLQIIEKEVQNISITWIAETHWKTNGHFTTLNGNLIISSSNEAEAANGVAVIVNKKIKEAITGYQLVNDRILVVKFRVQPVNLNGIQVYAPTSLSSKEDIQHFYNCLSEIIKKIPQREVLFVMGDCKAKVGSIMNDNHLRATVGKYGIGDRNEKGEMLMEFCIGNNLFIANTKFQHHKRRLYTWRSPDGKPLNQIDFMLVKSRWRTSVRGIKTYPGMGLTVTIMLWKRKYLLKCEE